MQSLILLQSGSENSLSLFLSLQHLAAEVTKCPNQQDVRCKSELQTMLDSSGFSDRMHLASLVNAVLSII